MIPKIIHQIWIGNNLISEEHNGFIQKWKEMYSDYAYILWDNERVDKENIIPYEKHKYFYSDKYPIVLKADLLRYKIIKKYGGIYVDVDTEPLRKMDESILNYRFFGGIQSNNQVAIGIFGADVECPLIVNTCENVINNIELKLESNCSVNWIDQLTGPEYFDRICNPYRSSPDYKFLSPKFFYPYWFTETHRRYEDFKTTCPDAYSVHHWSKKWL